MKLLASPAKQLDTSSFQRDNEGMFSRLGHWLLIVALIGATGAHWVMLQSVAWATMLADHAQTESFTMAVEKTFDGKHPCALCKQIAKARKSERKSDQQNDLKKLEFFNERVVLVFSPPTDFVVLPDLSTFLRSLGHAPPVPPPRDFRV